MKFLARSLSTTTVPPSSAQIKPLSEALAGLLEDSFEGARNEAATCLGTLMKIIGERPLNAVMDQLAEVRKVKVKEAFEKATVKCKAGGAPAARAPAAKASTKQAPHAAGDALLDGIVPTKPKAKPPARLMAKKAPVEDAPPPEESAAPEPPKPAVKQPARSTVGWFTHPARNCAHWCHSLASEKTFARCCGCCCCILVKGREACTCWAKHT